MTALEVIQAALAEYDRYAATRNRARDCIRVGFRMKLQRLPSSDWSERWCVPHLYRICELSDCTRMAEHCTCGQRRNAPEHREQA